MIEHRRFLFNLAVFLILPFSFLGVTAFLLPATPRASTSLLFSQIEKDLLLKQTASPRLILVGGSNLSLGIDSMLLKEELKLNPINTGIHAKLGLPFMLNWVRENVKSGDVVVVASEYEQFFGEFAFGSEELLRTIVDVDRKNFAYLSTRQLKNAFGFIPKLAVSKIKPTEYMFTPPKVPGPYERRSFNEFGDLTGHRSEKKGSFSHTGSFAGAFNSRVIAELIRFERDINRAGARLFLSFPCFERTSFIQCRAQIKEVELQLQLSGLTVLGNAERFSMQDTFMYDSPYHLRGEGTQIRTTKLIEDIENALANIPSSTP